MKTKTIFLTVILISLTFCQQPQVNQQQSVITPNLKVGQTVYGTDHQWNTKGIQQCIDTCGQDNATCLSICQRTGIIIGICIAVSVLILATIIISCICYRRKICAFYLCSKYGEIVQRMNKNVDGGDLSEEKFNLYVDQMIYNLSLSTTQPVLYQVMQQKNHRIKLQVKKLKSQPYLQQISIVGTDNIGKFVGKGYILAKNKGEIHLWFNKIYKTKVRSTYFKYYSNIVFESVKVDLYTGSIEGKYYDYRGECQDKSKEGEVEREGDGYGYGKGTWGLVGRNGDGGLESQVKLYSGSVLRTTNGSGRNGNTNSTIRSSDFAM